MDLHEILVLEGIEQLRDGVRSHDLSGPLPEILIKDTLPVLENIGRETVKRCAMVRVRNGLRFPGLQIPAPGRELTKAHWPRVLPGKTVFTDGGTDWEAYPY